MSHATETDADILLTQLSAVLEMVRDLNHDIDAGHEMSFGRYPFQTVRGPRMTLRRTRERLGHIEQRAARVFSPNGRDEARG